MRCPSARNVIWLILLLVIAPPPARRSVAETPPYSWQSDYDKAVGLHPRGNHTLAAKLMEKVRSRPRRLRIAVNAILVNEDAAEDPELLMPTHEERKRGVLVNVEPDSQSILGKKVIQATPWQDLRAGELIEVASCKCEYMSVVASFFVNTLDTQETSLRLTPDRMFRPFTKSGADAPDTATDPEFVIIKFRAVVSPDGKKIRFDLFDHANTVDVFEPRVLASTIAWELPSGQDVALGPPHFDFDDRATKFGHSIEVDDTGYFVISRIRAEGEREEKNGVPVLGRLPVLRKFLSSRKICKAQAQLVLVCRPMIDR